MEKLSRRKALLGLAAAGAGLTVVSTAKATEQRFTNPPEDRKERLQNVLTHLEIADDHLMDVQSRWTDPPEELPQLNALLNNIITECDSVMKTADELLKLTRG